MVETVNLDLGAHQVRGAGLYRAQYRTDAPGGGDVVVLDQDRIGKREAVIETAAVQDRLLFDEPQARGGLAGAGDADKIVAFLADTSGGNVLFDLIAFSQEFETAHTYS